MYHAAELRRDVIRDRDLLRRLAHRASGVRRAQDPKLKQLLEELAAIAAQAQREGRDEADSRDKRKVVIFSYFSDTVGWIEKFLVDALQTDSRLACYRDRRGIGFLK